MQSSAAKAYLFYICMSKIIVRARTRDFDDLTSDKVQSMAGLDSSTEVMDRLPLVRSS